MDELRADYKANGIGNLVYYELFELATKVVRKKRKSRSTHRADLVDSTQDLVHDFYTDGQVTVDQYKGYVEKRGSVAQRPKYWFKDPERGRCTHWVLELAHDRENLDEYRRFLYTWLDKTATRVNYRADPWRRLVDRSKKILKESPYTSKAIGKKGSRTVYFLGSPKLGLQEPTDDDLDRAARRAHEVHQEERHEEINEEGEQKKASQFYKTKDLEILLRLVAEELPMGFTEGHLRKIFERLLPSPNETSLEQLEETSTEIPSVRVDPGQETVLRSTVSEAMTSLTADEQMLLRGAFDEKAQQDVAAALGVTRQTVRNRSNALIPKLHGLLDDPTEAEEAMFLQLLQEAVMNSTPGGHDDG
ncbi:MAG: hypothetical protein QF558_09225 [Acidimicrobiales bacterium]|jgi:hypothetical protein|nr:hypothetical protein [Acidimicrobiales bacterium]